MLTLQERRREAVRKVVSVVRDRANEANWTGAYALDQLKRQLTGLTEGDMLQERHTRTGHQTQVELVWGRFRVVARACWPKAAYRMAAEELVVRIVEWCADSDAAGELATCFSRHDMQKRQPEGFETAVKFLCPFCSLKGDEEQREEVKRHIVEQHTTTTLVQQTTGPSRWNEEEWRPAIDPRDAEIARKDVEIADKDEQIKHLKAEIDYLEKRVAELWNLAPLESRGRLRIRLGRDRVRRSSTDRPGGRSVCGGVNVMRGIRRLQRKLQSADPLHLHHHIMLYFKTNPLTAA